MVKLFIYSGHDCTYMVVFFEKFNQVLRYLALANKWLHKLLLLG